MSAGVCCPSSEMDSTIKSAVAKLGRPAAIKGNDTRAIAKSNAQHSLMEHIKYVVWYHLQWLSETCAKISSLGVFGERQPNHVLINEYTPGQGIMVSHTNKH